MKITLKIIVIFLFSNHLFAQKEAGDEIIHQVIEAIEKQYYDENFNQKDWSTLRQTCLDTFFTRPDSPLFAVNYLLAALDDPTVRLLSPKAYQGLSAENVGNTHIGVGLPELLAVDMTAEGLEVIAPLHNSPAAAAGIAPNDVILSIDGVVTAGLSLTEVMPLLRQRKGEIIRLKVRRNGKIKKVKLKTTDLQPPLSPYYKIIEKDGLKIGCVWFPQFSSVAAPQFKDIIQDFEKQNIDGILLDLRNNYGGVLREVQRIGGYCMGAKGMASVQGKSNYLSGLPTLEAKITDLPMVVLVNAGTANTAELLAGALQHEKRATLIGEQTNGKGLIYTSVPLSEGYVLVLPIGRIFLYNVLDIAANGIMPDILVKNGEGFQFGKMDNDAQFLKAIDVLKNKK